MPTRSILTHLYTVGWICVTDQELHAARALLDEVYTDPTAVNDACQYVGGKMGEHHVIIGQSTRAGKAAANNTATHMMRSFSKIRFILMVGIAGGATSAPPEPEQNGPQDIFLGDVVVSRAKDDHSGILEYDKGRRGDEKLETRFHLNKTEEFLIRATNKLRYSHKWGDGHMTEYMDQAMVKLEQVGINGFRFPGIGSDLLFNSDYKHQPRNEEPETCENCDQKQRVRRVRRNRNPQIHYGLIGSGDSVIRDAAFRDMMRKDNKVLCFEMEGASLMNAFKCLVIRGISDYSDGHKNDLWQAYAALTAAAYAKDLLAVVQPEPLVGPETGYQLLEDMKDKERRAILTWLSTLDFAKQQDNLFEGSIKSHSWLVDMDIFEYWMKGCSWQLRCYGGTGVGKTHLCALIINHLQDILPKRFPNDTRLRPVIYLYLSDDQKSRAEQSKEVILGSLVKQLVQIGSASTLPEELEKAYHEKLPYEPTLKKVFEDLLETFERTYLIVDGMYQCSSEVYPLVKDYPLDLIKRGFKLSLLTTSSGYREAFKIIQCDNESCGRSNLNVYFNCNCTEEGYDLCLDCKQVEGISCPKRHNGREIYDTVRVEVRGRKEYIHNMCHQRLHKLSDTSQREHDNRIEKSAYVSSPLGQYLVSKPEMVGLIANEIIYNAQNNFLVANGWLEDLEQMVCKPPLTFDEIHLVLVSVPGRIFTSYLTERFKRIEHNKSGSDFTLASRAVSFVMVAFVPLTMVALQHALSLNADNVIRKAHLIQRVDILRAANGLLTVDKAGPTDSFVRLFHRSFRKIPVDSNKDFSFANHHSRMAKLCLKYLTHDDFLEHADKPESYPFLSYAMEYWGDHVREACLEGDSKVYDRARAFLVRSSRVKDMAEKAAKMAQNTAKDAQMDEETADHYVKRHSTIPTLWFNRSINALHLCAWYNLPDLIRDLHSQIPKSGMLDRNKRPPLRHACFNGSLEAVQQLLEPDLMPRESLQGTNSLIRHAAVRDAIKGLSKSTREDKEDERLIQRRIDIAKLILHYAGLTLDSPIDSQASTVLIYAVNEGLYNFTKILLERESVDVNVFDNEGRSALWHAMDSSDELWPSSDHQQVQDMTITGLLLSHGAIPGGVREQTRETSILAKAMSFVNLALLTSILEPLPLVGEFFILLLFDFLTS
ncbi:hypothetical protein N7540_002343 [Penicillium herquei]|nr:hypothetical protein N7540_002343 [Penicillium herquei]